MKIVLLTKNNVVDITEVISTATLSGEYRSCCRSLSFNMIKSPVDKNTQVVPIFLGDNIRIEEKGEVLFHGVVWTKSKTTEGNEINIECKDYGIYLLKNKCSYKFKELTPEAITKKVCKDFGIQVGSLALTGVPINRNFLGISLYDVILSSYTLANDKKYIIFFKKDKLQVEEKGITVCKPVKSEENLLSASVSESLEEMVNRVSILSKEDKLIKVIENAEDIKRYGKMGEFFKIQDTKEAYEKKARALLNGISQKINVTNLGDASYQMGKAVIVTEPYTGLMGKFFIDAEEHNWKNGVYTNKLTLNFKNLAQEKESGSTNG